MAKGMKTGGRAPGTPNQITKELREVLHEIVSIELQNIDEKLSKLTVRERLEIIVKLLPFVLPKLETTRIIDENTEYQTPIIINFPENFKELPSDESQVEQ